MDTSKGENTNVQIRPPLEILIEPANPRRTPIDELQGLARRIRRKGRRTIIRFAYYEPEEGKYGVTWAEIIHIWLPRMTDAIEAELIIEIVKIAAKWARKRIRKGSKSPKYVYIYSADGKILREIKINDKKQKPDIIIPASSHSVIRTKPPLRETAYNDLKYFFLLIRTIIKKTLTAIPRSLKYWPSARRIKKHNKAKQRALQLPKGGNKGFQDSSRVEGTRIGKNS